MAHIQSLKEYSDDELVTVPRDELEIALRVLESVQQRLASLTLSATLPVEHSKKLYKEIGHLWTDMPYAAELLKDMIKCDI